MSGASTRSILSLQTFEAPRPFCRDEGRSQGGDIFFLEHRVMSPGNFMDIYIGATTAPGAVVLDVRLRPQKGRGCIELKGALSSEGTHGFTCRINKRMFSSSTKSGSRPMIADTKPG